MKESTITAIILTYNEERHIGRCLENILPISEHIFVVDSYSSDGTCNICRKYPKVTVIQHKWPGNQAQQFNWALENLPIDTDWILRLDADEYLSSALIDEIRLTLPSLRTDITGCYMKRDVFFMGKRIRFGKLRPLKLLRLWRTGKAVIEDRAMDEHTLLTGGGEWYYTEKLFL